jgi:hypothetical protein
MEINICPRWLLEPMGLSPDEQPHFALFLSALMVLLASPLLVRVPHICLMQTLLGIPCPGCGVLHGLAALTRMDFAAAWRANPASPFLAALLGLQFVARPIALLWAKSGPLVVRASGRPGLWSSGPLVVRASGRPGFCFRELLCLSGIGVGLDL